MFPIRHTASRGLITISPLLISIFSAGTHAEQARQLPEMTVEGESVAGPAIFQIDLEQAPVTTPDAAELLRRAPGANVNRNGPLTGIAQYRGMYGDRVNVQVNGMNITTGGPNGMDPPLSYVPRGQLESLEVIRGIAPVSSGVETIGGTIIANAKSSSFATEDRITPVFDINSGGASVDESTTVSGIASVANRNHRLHVSASRDDGNNIEIPDGKIKPSRHERNNYAAGYGFRNRGGHEFSFDVRHNNTDPTGTPSLPMDIKFIDTDIVQGEYKGSLGDYALHGQLYWSDVNHEMSNFELRDPPMPTMTRLNDAKSDGLGYRADVGIPLASGTLLVGVDGHLDDHDATVTDPINNPAFRVEAFNDVERDVLGFFTEWNGDIAKSLNMQLGARYNRVEAQSGQVSHFMAMMNPAIGTLQNRFNSADRDNNQDNFNLVAKLDHSLTSQINLIAEGGMKTRAPSYQQLYLWVPLQATNGLADGHNYVGDLNLDSEKAYEAGFGLDWHGKRVYAAPRVFYRYVDDYIQGTPSTDPLVIGVSTANGDPNPLQWSNVDAKFYGADMDWGATITTNWRLDGVVSYVRGERDDINDDLYRIAPLNGSATLTYSRANWWAGVEGVGYAKQNKVSDTNDEEKSDSYTLLNLRGGINVMRNLAISVGVENVFDKDYEPHLSGINRVANSDVAVGDRVPGPGRNYFATLQYKYD
jgi:iron complex outermembrane receptor protein